MVNIQLEIQEIRISSFSPNEMVQLVVPAGFYLIKYCLDICIAAI
jgi:hypothetical protein